MMLVKMGLDECKIETCLDRRRRRDPSRDPVVVYGNNEDMP
jgi:hypothetical protein